MEIQTQTKMLWELRQEINQLEKAHQKIIEPLKNKREELQQQVLAAMIKEGWYSARYDFCTATCSVRKTPKLIDENKAIEWLEKNGIKEAYTAIRVTDSFDELMRQALKENKNIDGVEIAETQFISLRSPNGDDKRKVIVE